VPSFVLEMVSHRPGGEYDEKLDIYAKLGVLYYLVYNPEFWRRDGHQPSELYKLNNGKYQLQIGEPYWMPEVGLGIGRYQGFVGGLPQEILTWYGERCDRHLSLEEKERMAKDQAQLAREQEQRQRERLETFLRAQGFDPNNLPE
jgi:hypothetical protein